MGHDSSGKTLRHARAYQLLLDFQDDLGTAYAQMVDQTLKAAKEMLEDVASIETEADFTSADERRRQRIQAIMDELTHTPALHNSSTYWPPSDKPDDPHK